MGLFLGQGFSLKHLLFDNNKPAGSSTYALTAYACRVSCVLVSIFYLCVACTLGFRLLILRLSFVPLVGTVAVFAPLLTAFTVTAVVDPNASNRACTNSAVVSMLLDAAALVLCVMVVVIVHRAIGLFNTRGVRAKALLIGSLMTFVIAAVGYLVTHQLDLVPEQRFFWASAIAIVQFVIYAATTAAVFLALTNRQLRLRYDDDATPPPQYSHSFPCGGHCCAGGTRFQIVVPHATVDTAMFPPGKGAVAAVLFFNIFAPIVALSAGAFAIGANWTLGPAMADRVVVPGAGSTCLLLAIPKVVFFIAVVVSMSFHMAVLYAPSWSSLIVCVTPLTVLMAVGVSRLVVADDYHCHWPSSVLTLSVVVLSVVFMVVTVWSLVSARHNISNTSSVRLIAAICCKTVVLGALTTYLILDYFHAAWFSEAEYMLFDIAYSLYALVVVGELVELTKRRGSSVLPFPTSSSRPATRHQRRPSSSGVSAFLPIKK